MKTERFIKEYAKYKIEGLKHNTLMQTELRDKAIARINKVIAYREKGLITSDEAIKAILNCFDD